MYAQAACDYYHRNPFLRADGGVSFIPMTAKAKNPLKDFNLNSILVLVATAYIGWQVTTSLTTNKETNASVGKIETTLPFITKAQERLEGDVKQIKDDQKNLITRSELDNKHNRLLSELKDVKDEQKQVRDELNKKEK